MRSIDDVIADWKVEKGIILHGKNGPYSAIPFSNRLQHFMDLVATLIAEGYGEDDIRSSLTQNKVVEASISPKNAGTKGREEQKRITIEQWKRTIPHFFRGETVSYTPKDSSYVPPEQPKKSYKKEEKAIVEKVPENYVTIDDVKINKDILWDTDFIAELEALDNANKDKK